jgi:hypothetical protein
MAEGHSLHEREGQHRDPSEQHGDYGSTHSPLSLSQSRRPAFLYSFSARWGRSGLGRSGNVSRDSTLLVRHRRVRVAGGRPARKLSQVTGSACGLVL